MSLCPPVGKLCNIRLLSTFSWFRIEWWPFRVQLTWIFWPFECNSSPQPLPRLAFWIICQGPGVFSLELWDITVLYRRTIPNYRTDRDSNYFIKPTFFSFMPLTSPLLLFSWISFAWLIVLIVYCKFKIFRGTPLKKLTFKMTCISFMIGKYVLFYT